MNANTITRVLSLGAGVQSSALALMVKEGELEADVAIFADPGWEPLGTYEYLERLRAELHGILPIFVVRAGDIRAAVLSGIDNDHRSASLPLFTKDDKGKVSMLRRQCTREFKIAPIQKRIKEWQRVDRTTHTTLLMGISLDEVHRMKPSRVKYISHEFPLVDRRMSRHDCMRWMEAHGYEVPGRSACIGCPFHSDREWREIKKRPAEWEEAVHFDEQIRQMPRLRDQTFLHRSGKPLAEVDLSTAEDHGQLDLFDNECEGMCGV